MTVSSINVKSSVENEAFQHSAEVQGTGTKDAARLWPGASSMAFRSSARKERSF